MKTKNKLAITALILMSMNQIAFAQSEGSHGGDPNELTEFTGANGEHLSSWYSVKQDLIEGFVTNKYLQMDLGKNDANEFKTRTLEVLRSVQVEFDNLPIRVNDVPRACENYIENDKKHIHCNSAAYAETMKNYSSETQYKMVAHEYFSNAGFEPNRYGTSDYPLSDQISKSLSLVTVKKWAVSSKIRLVNTEMKPLQATGKTVFIKGFPAFQLTWTLDVLVGTTINFRYGSNKDQNKYRNGFETGKVQCAEVKWSEPEYAILHHTGQFECKFNKFWDMNTQTTDNTENTITGVLATELGTSLRAAGFDPEYTFNFGVANLQCGTARWTNLETDYACGGEILIDPNKGMDQL